MSTSNPNYIKFGPAETIVVFSTDRGELKTNTNGDYFYRSMADRRFCCVNPDLERKLLDLGYRAGEQVGIARQTRNRVVVWNVRMLSVPVEAAPAPPTAIRPAPRPTAKRTPPPLPEAKYAPPPPVAWPETEHAAPASPKPPARAIDARSSANALPGLDEVVDMMQECLYRAVEVAQRTQARATERGFPLTFSAGDVQDLASTIYIQISKTQNMDRVDRDRAQRAAGGADPWSRR
jgi:hypothetical protein